MGKGEGERKEWMKGEEEGKEEGKKKEQQDRGERN